MNNIIVKDLEPNLKLVKINEKELYLLGTAHVSAESVKEVEEAVEKYSPNLIAVELDEKRLDAILNKSRYEDINIIEIIKKKEMYFFIGKFIMSIFQKKISQKTGSEPGAEFKKAIMIAKEKDVNYALIDRNVGTTFKRAWKLTPFLGKIKLIGALASSTSKDKDIEAKDIEDLKSIDNLEKMIKEMGDEMPIAKQVIIDERDTYLAGKIQENLVDKTLAVVGAGHVPGMLENFKRNISKEELEEIDFIPKPTFFSKLLPWIIPLLILGIFAYGFFRGNSVPYNAIIYWVLINGILSALGTALALGHPISIITAFVAAPITSLNPTIGAGMVVGLIQAYLVPPRIKDFKTLQDDSQNIKGWYRNRFTRLLLVFILSSLGSAIGTFVAFPAIIAALN